MAFSEVGIQPDGSYQQYFNGNAPDMVRVSESNFCLPIFGLHHVRSDQMQSIENVMSKRQEVQDDDTARVTTYGDVLVMIAAIAKGHSDRDLEGRHNWDYLIGVPDNERHPIAWGRRKSAMICKATCEAHPDLCLAWVYKVETQDCWMSKHVVPGRPTPRSISGLNGVRLKQLRAQCQPQDWRDNVRHLESSRLTIANRG